MKPTLRNPLFLLLSLVLPLAGLLLWPASASAQDLFSAAAPENLLSNGGFEAEKPAYWDADGAGALWSDDVARTPGRSLALSGNASASWTQDEAVRNWVPRIIGNQEILVGGYVRTEGVNTNPASDADKFQLVFEFFNASGTDLLGEPLVLDVPQDQATSGDWVEISNLQVGPLTLPEDATSVRITFRKGASATGTAYLDDLFVRNAGEGGDWPGGFFNTNMDAGDTWYYWWDGFDTGNADWPDGQPFVQTVTDEEAHTGQYSLKIEQNDPTASESVAISERVPVTAGEPVLVSFWVKTEDVLHPDSIGTADYNIGLTALWYNQIESGSAGYGEIGGLDIRLNGDYNPNVIPLAPRVASSGWTQYAFVVYPRAEAVAMELRLRYWHHFEGITYWDDVFIGSLGGDALITTAIEDFAGGDEVPGAYRLHANYPNPFNPTTTLAFTIGQPQEVTLEVFNVLGQRVATLLQNDLVSAGRHEVAFDAARLPSGTYLYVLKTSHGVEARTMVLVK